MPEQTFDEPGLGPGQRSYRKLPTRLPTVMTVLCVVGCVGFFFAGEAWAGPYWVMFGVEWLWVGYSVVSYFQFKRESDAELLRLELELQLLVDEMDARLDNFR